ncbi:hypothetical protein HMI54_002918 [Coelomomyces lativittatus]|nr:hypothetical protein HMI54_002918 [Coelomomyces lativittatus]KAJ1515304.1 hypothetical protein HMI56_005864 [Coelomomyces lativittatus]
MNESLLSLFQSIVTSFIKSFHDVFQKQKEERNRIKYYLLTDISLPGKCVNPSYKFHSRVFLPPIKPQKPTMKISPNNLSSSTLQFTPEFFMYLEYSSSFALYLCIYFIFRNIIFNSKRTQRLAARGKNSLFSSRFLPFLLTLFASSTITSTLFSVIHPSLSITLNPSVNTEPTNASIYFLHPSILWSFFVIGFIFTIISFRFRKSVWRHFKSMTLTGELITLSFGALFASRFWLQLLPLPLHLYLILLTSLILAFSYYIFTYTVSYPNVSSLSTDASIAEAAKSLKGQFHQPKSPVVLQRSFALESFEYKNRSHPPFNHNSTSVSSIMSSNGRNVSYIKPPTVKSSRGGFNQPQI